LFRERILALGPEMKEHVLKLYIAFKSDTNVVDVVPRKKKLRLTLNMDFDDIDDPKGLCRDVTGKGQWGNGNIQVRLLSAEQLDDVMYLIGQAYLERKPVPPK
jgi:predicted transport protein